MGAISFDNLIEICIIFLIVFTPLAFGSVGLGPQIILITISEFIFLLFLLKPAQPEQLFFKKNIFSAIFFAFLALIIFQFIPLPKFLLKFLSPSTYKIYLDFLPGYSERQMWRTISVSPAATQIEFFKILSYGLITFITVNIIKTKEQIIRILTAISITGFIIALFGIIQKFTWNGMIYWIQPVPEGVVAFGPFVNKNHFAGFMELTIPITAAFVFISRKIEKKVLFSFMATAMLLALFLSLSRAGILSFFSALAILFLIVFSRRHLKKYLLYILPAILVICIGIFFIARVPLVERFSTAHEAFYLRAGIYKDIFHMFMDFPVFGIGAGAFGKVFSIYKTSFADKIFTHADSDWLQFLSETGLVGFSCIAIFIWLFFKDILYCWSKRHDRFVLTFLLSGTVSLTSIILHGIVDVNLHIPSNILLFCVVAGLSAVVAHGDFHE